MREYLTTLPVNFIPIFHIATTGRSNYGLCSEHQFSKWFWSCTEQYGRCIIFWNIQGDQLHTKCGYIAPQYLTFPLHLIKIFPKKSNPKPVVPSPATDPHDHWFSAHHIFLQDIRWRRIQCLTHLNVHQFTPHVCGSTVGSQVPSQVQTRHQQNSDESSSVILATCCMLRT